MPRTAARKTIFAVLLVAAFVSCLVYAVVKFGHFGRPVGPPPAVSLLWRFNAGSPIKGWPAIAGGRVYIGSSDGNFRALSLADGRELWHFLTGGEIEGGPLLAEGRLYFGSGDANLYCLDPATGAFLWSYATEGKIVGTPALLAGEGNEPCIVVGSQDYSLHCVRARDGHALWTYKTGYCLLASPVVAGEDVVFGGCDGNFYVLSPDGKEVLVAHVGGYMITTAAVEGGRACVAQIEGIMHCIDIVSGRTVWKTDLGPAMISSTPAAGAGRVVFGSQDGNVYGLDSSDGNVVWNLSTEEQVNGAAVIAGDLVLIGGNDGRMRAIRLSDGHEVWSYLTGEPIEGGPAVVRAADGSADIVVFGSDDGYVYALKALTPPASALTTAGNREGKMVAAATETPSIRKGETLTGGPPSPPASAKATAGKRPEARP